MSAARLRLHKPSPVRRSTWHRRTKRPWHSVDVTRWVVLWGAVVLLAGCDRQGATAVDGRRAVGTDPVATKPIGSSPEPATVRIAAVQYGGQDASSVHPRCDDTDTLCAIAALSRQAARAGAKLVVTPEYALGLDAPEVEPALASLPSTDPDRRAGTPVVVLSELAQELQIYLVVAMRTSAPTPGGGEESFNTQLAFGPDGRVVGKHHKIVLYEGESDELEPGKDVTAFDTPFGRVGMLICADLYGDPRLHERLTGELGASIIAFSTMWTVDRATRWQAAFARDWDVVVAAAGGSTADGRGGGIFGSDGVALVAHESAEPGVSIATIPVR